MDSVVHSDGHNILLYSTVGGKRGFHLVLGRDRSRSSHSAAAVLRHIARTDRLGRSLVKPLYWIGPTRRHHIKRPPTLCKTTWALIRGCSHYSRMLVIGANTSLSCESDGVLVFTAADAKSLNRNLRPVYSTS